MLNSSETFCLKNRQVFLLLLTLLMTVYLKYPLDDLLIVDAGDGAQMISIRQSQLRNIFQGDFAVWNKYLSAGLPTISTGLLFYPPAILLDFLSPEWYIYIYYCLHVAVGAFFFYLYLREIKCNFNAALVVAIIWLFSTHVGGFRKSHLNIITAISMLPIAMYCMQKFLNLHSLKWLVFSAVPLALGFMGGQQQVALYVAGTVFFYYSALSIHHKTPFLVIAKNCGIFFLAFIVAGGTFIFPTMEVLLEYSKYGAVEKSFSYFLVGSIHPIKLIQMIFPHFFGESIFQTYGSMNSSEMDIELYIGIIILFLSLFSIKNYWNNFYIKLSIVFCIVLFVYAAVGHIPVLREIIYRIPMLGGFRVPARSLSIFLFFLYAIIAIGISQLSKSEELERFLRFQRKAAIAFVSICGIAFLIIFTFIQLYNFQIDMFINHIKLAFMPIMLYVLGFSSLMYAVCIAINRSCKKDSKILYNILASALLVITLCETLSFSLMTAAAPANEIAGVDEASQSLKKDIGNYKIFDAFPSIDGAHQSIISQNKNIIKKMPAINSYIVYNNPILYRLFSGISKSPLNFSGLMTGSMNARNNVIFQNDILSMLGVKYIIDSDNFIPDNGTYPNIEEKELIYENSKLTVPLSTGTVTAWADIVSIKPQYYYMATFDFDTEAVSGEAYVDLYGENYDIADSQKQIDVDSNQNVTIGSNMKCNKTSCE
jgi:hypothetical protein